MKTTLQLRQSNKKTTSIQYNGCLLHSYLQERTFSKTVHSQDNNLGISLKLSIKWEERTIFGPNGTSTVLFSDRMDGSFCACVRCFLLFFRFFFCATVQDTIFKLYMNNPLQIIYRRYNSTHRAQRNCFLCKTSFLEMKSIHLSVSMCPVFIEYPKKYI